jgi:hypothetical protein
MCFLFLFGLVCFGWVDADCDGLGHAAQWGQVKKKTLKEKTPKSVSGRSDNSFTTGSRGRGRGGDRGAERGSRGRGGNPFIIFIVLLNN